MKAKDEVLVNLVKVLAEAGFSVVKMDTSPDGANLFQAERSGEKVSIFGNISLLIEAQ